MCVCIFSLLIYYIVHNYDVLYCIIYIFLGSTHILTPEIFLQDLQTLKRRGGAPGDSHA